RAVVVERVPVYCEPEAVEEVPRLAEGPIPGGLGVVGSRSADVAGQPVLAQQEAELVRLAGPPDARRIGARHRRVVVARAACELDVGGGSLRQTMGVAVRVAEHGGRDLVVLREAPGEENRPVAAALEGGLAE